MFTDVPEIGSLSGLGEATLGDLVSKFGRTTGLTNGRVTAVNAKVNVHFGDKELSINAFEIAGIGGQPFFTGGDGGAPVVDSDRRLVGIVFAGSVEKSFAVPVEPTLQQLGLALVVEP